MIWDEARWDGKIKEKWGKAYPDEPIAGRVQDYLESGGEEASDCEPTEIAA